jgi:hypothetical protein
MCRVGGILLACFLLAGVAPFRADAQSAPTLEGVKTALVDASQATARLTIAVVGDSLGDGLWEGLYRHLYDDKRFVVFRGAKNSVGFTGSDMTEQIEAAFAAGQVDALVIMIGANDDRRSFFINGRSAALFSTKPWIELYRERIEKFMDHAGRRNVPLVWILLPVMRSAEATAAALLINDIVTEAARPRSLVALVPIWNITGDEKGAYMPYFSDLKGKKRLMRHADGLHFTEAGYELLAHFTFNKLLEVSPIFRAMTPRAAESAVR